MNTLTLNQNPVMAFLNKHHSAIMRGLLFAAIAVLALSFYDAYAKGDGGTGADDFKDIYARIVAWTSGTLGKTVAISAFIIGIALGAIKGSFIGGIAGGIVVAVAITQMPTLINTIAGSTTVAAEVGTQLLSGLTHAVPLM